MAWLQHRELHGLLTQRAQQMSLQVFGCLRNKGE